MNDPVRAVVRRELAAPPEAVYDEWLDAEALMDWMCPRPAHPLAIALDPRVGGRLRIDIEEDGRQFLVWGRYLTLDRPRHLSFTWSCSTWENPELETIVSVTLEPLDEGRTLMTIEHRLLPADRVGQHQQGWTSIASQLQRKLADRSTTSV